MINRMVMDMLADNDFTTSEVANENLRKYGAREEQIFFVGNVMIDTLLTNLPRLRKPSFFDELELKEKEYLVLTLHRPANVDEANKLKEMMTVSLDNMRELPRFLSFIRVKPGYLMNWVSVRIIFLLYRR